MRLLIHVLIALQVAIALNPGVLFGMAANAQSEETAKITLVVEGMQKSRSGAT